MLSRVSGTESHPVGNIAALCGDVFSHTFKFGTHGSHYCFIHLDCFLQPLSLHVILAAAGGQLGMNATTQRIIKRLHRLQCRWSADWQLHFKNPACISRPADLESVDGMLSRSVHIISPKNAASIGTSHDGVLAREMLLMVVAVNCGHTGINPVQASPQNRSRPLRWCQPVLRALPLCFVD